MLTGNIDDNVRRYLSFVGKVKSAIAGKTVVVGHSGTFATERLFAEGGPAAIHASGTNLYTYLLGMAALGRAVPVAVREPDYAWFAPYLTTDNLWVRPAAVRTLLELLKWERRHNVHTRRMWNNLTHHFAGLVETNAVKLQERALPITSYSNCDVLEHFNRFADTPDAIYCIFFPFRRTDLDKLLRRCNEIIDWLQPAYTLLHEEKRREIIAWMTGRERRYCFATDEPVEGMTPVMVEHKKRDVWVYLYSNLDETPAVFRRAYPDTGARYDLAGPEFALGPRTQIDLVPINPLDVSYYKGLFLARNIDFSAGEYGFAVQATNRLPGNVQVSKVIGFIEMKRSRPHIQFELDGWFCRGKKFWYLMADFPTEPKVHPRVSKLIVMLALTDVVRKRMEHQKLENSWGVVTTAHTHRPVSMKYRGPLKLVNKIAGEDGTHYLNYACWWPGTSIKEAYRTWWQRYGTVTTGEED